MGELNFPNKSFMRTGSRISHWSSRINSSDLPRNRKGVSRRASTDSRVIPTLPGCAQLLKRISSSHGKPDTHYGALMKNAVLCPP
jgi:hypothetical protein